MDRLTALYPGNRLESYPRDVFTGDVVEGPRLHEIGLVSHLVERSQLEAFTYALANRIAGNAPLSIKGIKKTLNLLSRQTAALSPEQESQAKAAALKALNSEDLVEGQAALKAKRKPLFKGR